MTTRIRVGGTAPYDVLVGSDLVSELAPAVAGSHTVAVIHSAAVAAAAARVVEVLAGCGPALVCVPDGEAAKDLAVAAYCWDRLAQLRLGRDDAVVAVGGGAVTDLAGFVAATWLRGVRVVHLSTTLLGMVDAAVGGKTAINTSAGKNLVGAFHPPTAVLCDLDSLATLPTTEYVSGLAEVVKVGFLADPAILDLIEADPAAAIRPNGPHTRELVERAIRVKAAVVGDDLREHAGRVMLNYGHTLGHAIEKVEGYRWRHGAAVSVGLVYAATLARLAGRLDAPTAARHARVLASVGLPTAYRADAWPALYGAMRIDKKARGDQLRFVILDGIGHPAILPGPEPELLAAAYAEVSK